MTVRDPEVVDALRDDPELLATADAINATQRRLRPARLRRAAPRLAIVGAAAAAVALAILLWRSAGRGSRRAGASAESG
jgi:hypothetical protein